MTEAFDWSAQAESIARFYGKGKETSAGDGSWMTLCPVHGDSGKPNLHVSAKGEKILLHCHACGDTRQREIVQTISSQFQLSLKRSGAKVLRKQERGQWINPIPSNAPERPTTCWLNKELGNQTPTRIWQYLSPSKEVILYNARFDYVGPDGRHEKAYRRLALFMPAEGEPIPTWSWFGPDTALPLYGLEQLEGEWWRRPVLLVEGEKAADAAAKLFPNMVVIAFPGGAGNYNRINWTPLFADRKIDTITLWPDNDAAGRDMAYEARGLPAFLSKFGVRTRVVPVFGVPELPRKWDLADPLPEGWTLEHLTALMDKATYVDALDVGRVLKYCPTLKDRNVSLKELSTLTRKPCDELRRDPSARCHQCFQSGRIGSPGEISERPLLQLEWAYLTSHKFFYNFYSREMLDATGINALWAAKPGFTLTGMTSASSRLLTDADTTKVYDFAYSPGAPILIEAGQGLRVNRWRGFRVAPDTTREPTPWLDLAKYLIADDSIREHVFDWLAHLIQNPGVKANHGLLLISEQQGIGKDSFVQPLRQILGEGYRDITSQVLDSEFSEYLMDTKLLVISELDTIGHRRSTYDKLKPLLAGPPNTLNVNIKNMRQIEIENVVQVIAFSNKDVPIAIEDSDRRWLVYRMSHGPEDVLRPETFDRYYAWLRDNGAAQVLGWLLQRDVSEFDASKPAPGTEHKRNLAAWSEMKHEALAERIEHFVPPFDADIIPMREVVANSWKGVGKVTARDLAKVAKRMNAAIYENRIRQNGVLMTVFICRHADFWRKQGSEVIRRAMENRWVDMQVGKSLPVSGEPGGADFNDDGFELS